MPIGDLSGSHTRFTFSDYILCSQDRPYQQRRCPSGGTAMLKQTYTCHTSHVAYPIVCGRTAIRRFRDSFLGHLLPPSTPSTPLGTVERLINKTNLCTRHTHPRLEQIPSTLYSRELSVSLRDSRSPC